MSNGEIEFNLKHDSIDTDRDVTVDIEQSTSSESTGLDKHAQNLEHTLEWMYSFMKTDFMHELLRRRGLRSYTKLSREQKINLLVMSHDIKDF
jgi:hypothetical protein